MKTKSLVFGLIISVFVSVFSNVTFVLAESSGEDVVTYPILAPMDTWYTGNTLRSAITQINIVDTASEEIISTAEESWPAAADAQKDGVLDNDIMCYVNGTILTISGNGSGKISMNCDSRFVFSDSAGKENYFSGVTSISGTDILDTSNVVSMAGLFQGCGIETIDISSWNTSAVIDMIYMFNGCTSLTSVDMSSLDFSAVIDMSFMFNGCTSLTSVGVTSGWDLSNVKSIKALFQNCPLLTGIDVTNWNTGNIIDMGFAFWGNESLSSLDVSKWNTAQCKSFDHLFAHCIRLVVSGVENWNTSSAQVMCCIFHSTRNTSLDLSGWNTSNVFSFNGMFEYMSRLTEIKGLENWDTSKGVCFMEMFHGCTNLKSLDLSSFDTRNATFNKNIQVSGNKTTATSTYRMLGDCHSLEKVVLGENFTFLGDGKTDSEKPHGSLPVPSSTYISGADGNWYDQSGTAYAAADIPNKTEGTYYAYAVSPAMLGRGDTWYKSEFADKSTITAINIVDSYNATGDEDDFWDASALEDGTVMCYINGTTLTIAGNNGSGKIYACGDSSSAFSGFTALTEINGLENLDTSKAVSMQEMFYDCPELNALDLSGFSTDKVMRMDFMFKDCSDLTTIYVSDSFNTDTVTISQQMFYGCTNLQGGNGTAFNSQILDKTYACIDSIDTPGYFTSIADKLNLISFESVAYSAEENTLAVSVNVDEELQEEDGMVIIAVFDGDNFIGAIHTDIDQTASHTFENLPQTENRFTVKAFCWSGFDSLTALCNFIYTKAQ